MPVVKDRVALVNRAQDPTIMALADPKANDAFALLVDKNADGFPAAHDSPDKRQQRMIGRRWWRWPRCNDRRRNDRGG